MADLRASYPVWILGRQWRAEAEATVRTRWCSRPDRAVGDVVPPRVGGELQAEFADRLEGTAVEYKGWVGTEGLYGNGHYERAERKPPKLRPLPH